MRDRTEEYRVIGPRQLVIAGVFVACWFAASLAWSVGWEFTKIVAVGFAIVPFIVLWLYRDERKHAHTIDLKEVDRQTRIAVAEGRLRTAEARKLIASIDHESDRIDMQRDRMQRQLPLPPAHLPSPVRGKVEVWTKDEADGVLRRVKRDAVQMDALDEPPSAPQEAPRQIGQGSQSSRAGDGRLPQAATIRVFARVLRDGKKPRASIMKLYGMTGDVNEYTRAKAVLTANEFLQPTPERVGAEWTELAESDRAGNAEQLEAYADELERRARAAV